MMFYTSYDVHLSHCACIIAACLVFNIILRVLYFIKNRMYFIKYIILNSHFRRDHESSGFRKLAVNNEFVAKIVNIFLINLVQLKTQKYLDESYHFFKQ